MILIAKPPTAEMPTIRTDVHGKRNTWTYNTKACNSRGKIDQWPDFFALYSNLEDLVSTGRRLTQFAEPEEWGMLPKRWQRLLGDTIMSVTYANWRGSYPHTWCQYTTCYEWLRNYTQIQCTSVALNLPAFCDGKYYMEAHLQTFERDAENEGWEADCFGTYLSSIWSWETLEVYSRRNASEARE